MAFLFRTMNGYICYYKSKRIEVYADTSYAAQKEAARILKVPAGKEYKVSVYLAQKGDEQVETVLE